MSTDFTADSVLDTWLGAAGLCVGAPEGEVPGEASVSAVRVVCARSLDIYAAALYWAMMTITSIGYGDIPVSASNPPEQMIAVLWMLMSSIVWGFVIATLLNIANNSDPASFEFRQAIEELNTFVSRHGLPDDVRTRLREYFHESRSLVAQRSQLQLISVLSPKLLEEVTVHAYVRGSSLEHIVFLRGVESSLLAKVYLALQHSVYPPNEQVPPGCLHMVTRGRVSYCGSTLRKGQTWGHDTLLTQQHMRLNACAHALSYVGVASITGEQLLATALEANDRVAYRQMRRYAALIALRRLLVWRLSARRLHVATEKRRAGGAMQLGSQGSGCQCRSGALYRGTTASWMMSNTLLRGASAKRTDRPLLVRAKTKSSRSLGKAGTVRRRSKNNFLTTGSQHDLLAAATPMASPMLKASGRQATFQLPTSMPESAAPLVPSSAVAAPAAAAAPLVTPVGAVDNAPASDGRQGFAAFFAGVTPSLTPPKRRNSESAAPAGEAAILELLGAMHSTLSRQQHQIDHLCRRLDGAGPPGPADAVPARACPSPSAGLSC